MTRKRIRTEELFYAGDGVFWDAEVILVYHQGALRRYEIVRYLKCTAEHGFEEKLSLPLDFKVEFHYLLSCWVHDLVREM